MKLILSLLIFLSLFNDLFSQDTKKKNFNVYEYQWLNKKFPVDTLISYSQDTLLLSSDEKRVRVISFWYVSCPPCIAEIPALNKLKKKYAISNVEFIAIAFDNWQNIQEILKQHPFTFDMYYLDKKVIKEKRLTIGYPTNIILDKNSIVRFQKSGGSNDEEESMKIIEILSVEIEKLITE